MELQRSLGLGRRMDSFILFKTRCSDKLLYKGRKGRRKERRSSGDKLKFRSSGNHFRCASIFVSAYVVSYRISCCVVPNQSTSNEKEKGKREKEKGKRKKVKGQAREGTNLLKAVTNNCAKSLIATSKSSFFDHDW